MKPKMIHHICIQTNCYEQSLEFYSKVLEFDILQETRDFHGRDYNTWLKLESFMIELQTPKSRKKFESYNKESEGIVHFCIYVDDFEYEYQRIKSTCSDQFLKKNGKDIYQVENGLLFKLKAPEGTIIEVRDSIEL